MPRKHEGFHTQVMSREELAMMIDKMEEYAFIKMYFDIDERSWSAHGLITYDQQVHNEDCPEQSGLRIDCAHCTPQGRYTKTHADD